MGYQLGYLSINNARVSNKQKEQELIKGLALDDKTAIEAIYKDNYGLIQNLVINNSGTEDDAKDIFQEALIVLYEKSK